MARVSFTIEDNPDSTVEVKSDQDLPFGRPDQATNAELLAMYLINIITKQTQAKPKYGLVLPTTMH